MICVVSNQSKELRLFPLFPVTLQLALKVAVVKLINQGQQLLELRKKVSLKV